VSLLPWLATAAAAAAAAAVLLLLLLLRLLLLLVGEEHGMINRCLFCVLLPLLLRNRKTQKPRRSDLQNHKNRKESPSLHAHHSTEVPHPS
jgi:hypothetical protein